MVGKKNSFLGLEKKCTSSLVVITMTETISCEAWLVEFILWKGTCYMYFFLLSDTSRLPCTKWTPSFGHGAKGKMTKDGHLSGSRYT
jgi:hypothetical protein